MQKQKTNNWFMSNDAHRSKFVATNGVRTLNSQIEEYATEKWVPCDP